MNRGYHTFHKLVTKKVDSNNEVQRKRIEKQLARQAYLKKYRAGEEYRRQRKVWFEENPNYCKKDYQQRILRDPEYFRRYREDNRDKLNAYWKEYHRKKRLTKCDGHNEKLAIEN